MDANNRAFTAGLAIGRQLKGWSQGGSGSSGEVTREEFDELVDRVSALEAAVAALSDGWIHEINGVEVSGATINFITNISTDE